VAMRSVVILGSTGSIGTQALDVVRGNPGRFRVAGLAAGGSHVERLAEQALEFGVEVVAVARATAAQDLQLALYAAAKSRGHDLGEFSLPKVLAGPSAASDVAAWRCDVVLNAMTGSIGLAPTLATLEAGTTLALANKESLIVGGSLVKAAAKPSQIVPIDSEHSAISQCLRAGHAGEVSRLVLTASGGPFRGRSRAQLGAVTPAEALSHPTWDMGPVVTINSATMVNKGLEVIEAQLLFDIPMDRIDVVVHPQSEVHSMVEFSDGSTMAQANPPDMRLPIALGLAWPERVAGVTAGYDWSTSRRWDFEPLDGETFRAVALARTSGAAGHAAPAVYNAANEECVAAFLAGALPFLAIVDTIETVVGEHLAARLAGADLEKVLTIDDVLSAEAWARARTNEILEGAR
jgi:1-deoxy-D-xylulose 5-phosphate reductoisomerase